MPRSFLIKKKSGRETPAELSRNDEDSVKTTDHPFSPDVATFQSRKHDPDDDATVLVPVPRRTTIWSPASELHVDSNIKTSAVNVSPTSGLTPFTPMSAAAAAAAAFLHPKGNFLLLLNHSIVQKM